MARKFQYESAEPLWPRRVVLLVPAGFLVGLILGQCSFDDPNPLKNGWTWLGVFGVILCSLAWSAIRAQHTVARQVRVGILLSLITHVAVLFAIGNASLGWSSRGELPPQFTPWHKKEVQQQVYLGEPKIEVIPRQESQPPVDTESLKAAVQEKSPRQEQPAIAPPDDTPLAPLADTMARLEPATFDRPEEAQQMPLSIAGSPMLRRQVVEGTSQPTTVDEVPAAAPPAGDVAQTPDVQPASTARQPLAANPRETQSDPAAPSQPTAAVDRRLNSPPASPAGATEALPRQRRTATVPPAATAAVAPEEATKIETTSAPQLRPVPGRVDRAVGSAPSGATFGQPATDLAISTSPTMLPPLEGAAASRGDVAGKLSSTADTARPVARRAAAAIVPGAVVDDLAEPPLRAIPPGAVASQRGGPSTGSTGSGAKGNAVASGDGTATGGRRASGNVTVPTLALPGLSGTGAEAVLPAGGPSRGATSDVATVTHLQEDRFVNRRIGGLPPINAPVRDRAEAYRSRTPLGRASGDLGPAQPGAKAEDAIQLGLEFLVRYQLPDGRWSLHSFQGATVADAGSVHSDAAATGLALLSFLGAGYDHYDLKYQTTVSSGLAFLLKNQKADGDLYFTDDAESNKSAWLYSHAIATLALCESYGMTGDKKLQEPAQRAIDFIVKSQNMSSGGWRYTPGVSGDTSVTGWQLMALKSGELAGLKVPRSTLERIKGWLDFAQVEGSGGSRYTYNPDRPLSQDPRDSRRPTMTSVGLLMRLYLGWNRQNPALIAGAKTLQASLPEMGQRGSWTRDTYYWYYATQVMYHMGGDYWKAWNERLHPLLMSTQIRTGDVRGSWDPTNPVPDRWGSHGGRIYVTTLNLLSLEVTYRNLPIYEATRGE